MSISSIPVSFISPEGAFALPGEGLAPMLQATPMPAPMTQGRPAA